jgi:hypothetical protein
MRTLIILLLILLVNLSAGAQGKLPDLKNSEDLKLLGAGRIIEKDKSIIKNITLREVREFWIVYLKDESLHDMLMEEIACIEFRDTRWGYLKIEFPENKPEIIVWLYKLDVK